MNSTNESSVKTRPDVITDRGYRYDDFISGTPLLNKKKGHLPAMGWNSWNAFGSGNTEALTKAMADKICELGLDKLGYSYVVLDDGCYKPERVNGLLSNEEVKFPSGFKALADYIHAKGLKFGMYNDIGTNLCAGAAVGTCGHEEADAQTYADWDVDFLKVDNCYYLWDNATFSNPANAKYVYTPLIRSAELIKDEQKLTLDACEDGILRGEGGVKKPDEGVSFIGTFDGTGPDATPIGPRSSELVFNIDAPEAGEYELILEYEAGERPGVGSWLQVAVGDGADAEYFYDDFISGEDKAAGRVPGASEAEMTEAFSKSEPIKINLKKGANLLRLMNHRRQENTLCSYAALLAGLNKAKPGHDIILSICEWGKTQPQNWGYKVGDSWRILNDITFSVGWDGNPGRGSWSSGYTTGVTSQYNKAVIMDSFAGLGNGWNDPDMLMIGMDGITMTMNRTHMTMWCMMNSPLMLGLDLRRVHKGDELYRIIADEELIALNQDPLGVQAKRIFCTLAEDAPDTTYVRSPERADILAKPLADGSVALSFINLSETGIMPKLCAGIDMISEYFGNMPEMKKLCTAKRFRVKNLACGDMVENTTGVFEVEKLMPCESVTVRIWPE